MNHLFNHNRTAKAFTLLEMILAMSLAMGLMVSMMWFYRYTAEVRDTVGAEVQRITSKRRVMDHITRRLRGSMTYPFLDLGLEGRTDQITFMTTMLPDRSVWAVADVTEDAVTPQQDIHLVGIGLKLEEDEEDGALYIVGLESTQQSLITALIVTEDEEGMGAQIDTTVLSPFIYFVRFRYWDGSAWVEQWPPEDGKAGLPLAVEVALGEQVLPENVDPIDYPYELSTRVVFLPSAVPTNVGNIIQGLSGSGGL